MSLPERGAGIQLQEAAAPPRPLGLLVFADDWGRHPSSCQHLIRELLPQLPVVWVNTIGTRKPRLDVATVKRAWGKIVGERSSRGGRESLAKGDSPSPKSLSAKDSRPHVVSPLMWPYFTRGHDRWLNRKLLTRKLSAELANKPGYTALTTLPITADLIGDLPVAKWVYYCVDDFSQWPGLDGQTLETMERELVAKVDVIVAAGEVLRERMRVLGRDDAHLLTHGVDLERWQSSTTEPLYLDLPRPLIVFWGLIDRRLDIDWIAALSHQLTEGKILFVGPAQDPDPRLADLPRVAIRPALRFEELPQLARQATALIMPYADLPVTRAMQPLKLLEYLATGKPVICRDLPAVAPWRDALDACSDAETFTRSVLARFQQSTLPLAQSIARERLKEESWRAKAQTLLRWL